MSIAALAKMANLYDGAAVAAGARGWLEGPGGPFLGLKSSEVAGLRRATVGARTQKALLAAILEHIRSLAKRRKGASRWDHVTADGATMLESLGNWIVQTANAACASPAPRDAWGRVNSRLNLGLGQEQRTALDEYRRGQASQEFVDYLVRLHQARQQWKEALN